MVKASQTLQKQWITADYTRNRHPNRCAFILTIRARNKSKPAICRIENTEQDLKINRREREERGKRRGEIQPFHLIRLPIPEIDDKTNLNKEVSASAAEKNDGSAEWQDFRKFSRDGIPFFKYGEVQYLNEKQHTFLTKRGMWHTLIRGHLMTESVLVCMRDLTAYRPINITTDCITSLVTVMFVIECSI